MSEKLYEALEVCLQALETGADPELAVKLFPEMEEQLLPLLETSRQARSLAIPVVPERVLRRTRARVLQHASVMRASAGRQPKPMALFTFPRLAISLAFALLFLLSGTNLVRASGGALPGDQLYPVKRTWEDVRLLLVFSPASRQELESAFEQERLHEVDELLAEGAMKRSGSRAWSPNKKETCGSSPACRCRSRRRAASPQPLWRWARRSCCRAKPIPRALWKPILSSCWVPM